MIPELCCLLNDGILYRCARHADRAVRHINIQVATEEMLICALEYESDGVSGEGWEYEWLDLIYNELARRLGDE